jgi:hypothetical protein
MTKLLVDKELLLQTLRGYEEMNRFVDLELKASLPHRTHGESVAMFDALYKTWMKTGRMAGGKLDRFEREKIEEKFRVRRAFEAVARKRGDI